MFVPASALVVAAKSCRLYSPVCHFIPTEHIKEKRMAQETPQDQEILKAIRNIKFGSVEVVIHDSKVVQIEKKEKIRFQGVTTKP